eukprot:gene22611-23822_t
MREITQREYQWIEQFGGGHRANMPGYAGLEVWDWNAHSLSETAVAIAGSVLVALVVSHYAADPRALPHLPPVPLHLTKVAFGATSLDHLAERLRQR